MVQLHNQVVTSHIMTNLLIVRFHLGDSDSLIFGKYQVVSLLIDKDPSLFGYLFSVRNMIFDCQMNKVYVPSLSVNAYFIHVNC